MTLAVIDPPAQPWHRRLVELRYGIAPETLLVCTLDNGPETLIGDDPPPRNGGAIRIDDDVAVFFVDGERVGLALYTVVDGDERVRGSNRWLGWEVIYEPTAHR